MSVSFCVFFYPEQRESIKPDNVELKKIPRLIETKIFFFYFDEPLKSVEFLICNLIK